MMIMKWNWSRPAAELRTNRRRARGMCLNLGAAVFFMRPERELVAAIVVVAAVVVVRLRPVLSRTSRGHCGHKQTSNANLSAGRFAVGVWLAVERRRLRILRCQNLNSNWNPNRGRRSNEWESRWAHWRRRRGRSGRGGTAPRDNGHGFSGERCGGQSFSFSV
jgi:hypothetical protein